MKREEATKEEKEVASFFGKKENERGKKESRGGQEDGVRKVYKAVSPLPLSPHSSIAAYSSCCCDFTTGRERASASLSHTLPLNEQASAMNETRPAGANSSHRGEEPS